MTEDQRDDLITELSLYEGETIRSMVADYIEYSKSLSQPESIYDYLAERIEIKGYWEKVGLQ